MFLKLRTLLLSFFVMVFGIFSNTTFAQSTAYADAGLDNPTITSDKEDYSPGEVAHIIGTGWTLDKGTQAVHVEFKESPDYPDYHIYDVDVDENGNWSIDYAIEDRHLGVTFTVYATGKESNYTATTVFTDGINKNPDPATVCVGSNTSFDVTLNGSGQATATYKWQVSTITSSTTAPATSQYQDLTSSPIYSSSIFSGVTASTLNITGVTIGLNNYWFRCVVRQSSTDFTSTGAKLTVNALPATPTISPAPSTSFCAGGSVTLSSSAATSYQWNLNGVTLGNGATSQTFSATVAGNYSVTVTNSSGCFATSAPTAVTVNPLPDGTLSGNAICSGGNGQLTFTASAGTGPFTVQYQTGSTTYTANNVTSGTAFNVAVNQAVTTTYNLISVTDANGCTKTYPTSGQGQVTATITIGTSTNITSAPASTSVCEGGTASFTVAATGANLTYQWQDNTGAGGTFVNIPSANASATTNSLSLSNVTTAMSGRQYKCIVTGDCGQLITNTVTLTVSAALTITTQPATQTVTYGDKATFTVATTGGAGLTYQWQEYKGSGNFSDISNGSGNGATTNVTYAGATTNTLEITRANVTNMSNSYQYRCVISSTGTCASSITSNQVLIVVDPKLVSASFTANDKPYDATNVATIKTSSVTGALPGDAVSIKFIAPPNLGYPAFSSKNVGDWFVTASNLSFAGNDAANYTLVDATHDNTTATSSAKAAITAKPITTLTFTVDNKRYNGTDVASINTINFGTDNLDGANLSWSSASAAFSDKNVATGKIVTLTALTLSGTTAGNYSITLPYATTTTANITLRPFVIGITADDKIYDGGTTAAVHAYITAATTSFNGKVAGDDLTAEASSGLFPSRNVGTYNVSASTSFSGAAAGNYTLSPDGPDPLLPAITGTATTSTNADNSKKTAKITAKGINVTAKYDERTYNGTTSSTVVPEVDALEGTDVVATDPIQKFDTKHAGSGKTLAPSGLIINDGNSGNNYAVTYVVNTTGKINPKDINVTANTDNRVYNGTDVSSVAPTVDQLETGDAIATNGSPIQKYDDKHAGTGKTLTSSGLVINDGNSDNNYTVHYVTNTTGVITPYPITVKPRSGQSKVYGTIKVAGIITDPVLTYDVLNSNTLSVVSLFNGDSFSGLLGRISGEGAGTYDITQGTLALSSDYTLTFSSTVVKFTITSAPVTTSVSVSAATQQYSDLQTFTATIVGGAPLISGGPQAASSVTFKVGTQAMGTAGFIVDPNNANNIIATLTDAKLVEIAPGNGQMAPGVKTVTACITGVSSNYSLDNANPITSFTINKEDAQLTYTGQDYVSLPSSTTNSAVTISLSATIKDLWAASTTPVYPASDANRGNIKNAKVTFRMGTSTGAVLGTANLPASLVTDSTTGVVSTTFSYTLTNTEFTNGGTTLTIYAIVDGYYTSDVNTDPFTVQVSRPGADFVTGGGYLLNTANTKGKIAGTAGLKTNFGFNMLYTKSGSNLKGQSNIIVRNNGKKYQIKSTAINTLVVGTSTSTGTPAYYNTKANLTDITNPLAPISLGGNLDLTVKMNDVSTGGQGDQVSILLMGTLTGSSTSELIFSSNWDGTQTILQNMGGGNVSVRSAVVSTTNTNQAIELNTVVPEITDATFGLTAFPNPSASQFNVHLQSSNTTDKITLRMYDAQGRTVQVLMNLYAGQTVKVGSTYKPGIYYAEMLQGKDRKQVQLLKAAY